MNTSALNTTTVEPINMDAEISSLLEDVNHNELNHRLLQDIKLEDVDIKLEPVSQDDSMSYEEEEEDEAMLLKHINLNYLKEEIEPVSVEDMPDAFPHQALPTKCYNCGPSDDIIKRRTIVTRLFQLKLETHTICHLPL